MQFNYKRQGKEEESIHDSHQTLYKSLLHKAETLMSMVYKQMIINGNVATIDIRRVLNQWCSDNTEKADHQNFKGTNSKVSLDFYIQTVELTSIYLSFDFFQSSMWPWRFEKKFQTKISQFEGFAHGGYDKQKVKRIIHLFCYLSQILDGNFDSGQIHMRVQEIPCQDLQPHQAYFQAQVFEGKSVIFCVGIEKLPRLTTQQTIVGFEYVHCIRFLDIHQTKDQGGILKFVEKYQKFVVLKDPARSDFAFMPQASIQHFNITKDPTSQGYSQSQQKQRTQELFKVEQQQFISSKQFGEQSGYTICQFTQKPSTHISGQIRWSPSKFNIKYLTKQEICGLVFNETIYRWVALDYQSAIEQNQYQAYQASINREMLNKYADFTSAGKLVELLQKIPNFRIKLTEEEQQIVGAPGNLLVIGRSGTGKTTCAVLRMFAMELLFKLRLQLYKQKHQGVLQDTRFSADDIDGQIGLHCIFATASPVLTTEVQRYYIKLTDQVKQELEKKKERLRRENEEKSKQKQSQLEDSFEVMDTNLFQSDNQEDQTMQQKQQEEEENFIKDQIEDIALEDEQEAFKEDEDIDEEEIELKEKMNKFVSLGDLKDNQFPAFLTIRKLILMIDGAMSKPFFSRTQNKQVVGTDAKANWHNENQGVLMIDNFRKKMKHDEDEGDDSERENEEEEKLNMEDEGEVEQEYERQMYLQGIRSETSKMKAKSNKQMLPENVLARELDFDVFSKEFCCTVSKQYQFNDTSVLNATMVWTEIYSYIKGSAHSHEYPGYYLPKSIYLINDARMLSIKMKETVYEIFILYERWKARTSYYDMMDVVNYLLVQFKYGRYSGAPVHYLMIDEVQDLPHATLLLLSKITEQGLFFAGDTAQNIAKGVGFRFCDLKSLFNQKYFGQTGVTPPIVKQLTVNFRSHNQILEVANSLVTLIELFFPKTIDRLKKERSNIVGPKPMILQGNDIDLLFFVLSGQEAYQQQQQQTNSLLQRPPLEFGCNQVIIVKDQQSKLQLPGMLQHALCLTIYEAKGLEFDDVVLYNFFSDSKIPEKQWNLLNYINNIDQWIDAQIFYNDVTQHKLEVQTKIETKSFDDTSSGSDSQSDDEDQDDNGAKRLVGVKKDESQSQSFLSQHPQADKDDQHSANMFGLNESGGKVQTKRLQVDPKFYQNTDIIEYSQLCVELKQLYVAVTRPRNRLIIYDENVTKRAKIQKLWESLDLVDIVSQSEIQKAVNVQSIQFKEVATKTQKSEWKKQGLKMLRNRFYEQAMKCFQQAQEEPLENRAKAYHLAEIATKQMSDIQVEKNTIQAGQSTFLKKQKIAHIKSVESQARLNYIAASQLFQRDGKLRQSAQCLYSAQKYSEALNIYTSLGLWNQAGEAAYNCKLWREAGEYFDKAEDYIRCIDCFEKIQKWEKILTIIHKYKASMTIHTREAYLKQYLPIALDEILKDVDTIPQLDEGTKLQPKKEIQEPEPVIYEDDLEEEDQEDDDQEFVDDEGEGDNQDDELEVEENEIEVESQQNQEVQEELLSEQAISSPELVSQVSFPESEASIIQIHDKEKINLCQSQQSEQLSLSQFEHLSHVDFEDEFIKADRQSLMESIKSGCQIDESCVSEFSAISFDTMQHNPKMQLVKTKGDIYIQDNVMQRIIRFISMFSDDFKYSLLQQKSKSVQLTQQQPQLKQDSELDYMIDFILDLDLVDMEFIYLVLDTLESFKQFKLCIFVCNRYKLSTKVGRYLSAIGARYSPLALEPIIFKSILIQDGSPARQQKLDQSRVAHFTLHAVLENINPDYLRMTFPDQQPTQALGLKCFQQLAQLGYWKKCLYALDYHNALKLAESFSDYSNWKYIYLTYRSKKLMNNVKLIDQSKLKDEALAEQKKLQEQMKFCFEDQMIFQTWPFKYAKTPEECEFALITYEEYINKVVQQIFTLNILPNKIHKPNSVKVNLTFFDFQIDQILPDQFKYTQSFINSIIFQKYDDILSLVQSITTDISFLLKKQIKLDEQEQLQIIQCIHLSILLFNIMTNSQNHIKLRLVFIELPRSVFLDLYLAIIKILKILQQGISHHTPYIERACLGSFLARSSQSEVLQHFLKGQVIVDRNSPLVNDLLEIRLQEEQRVYAFNNPVATQQKFNKIGRSNKNDFIDDEKILTKIQNQEEMFFIDLDLNFVMVPYKYVVQVIQKKIKYSLSNILKQRVDLVLTEYKSCHEHYAIQVDSLDQVSFFLTILNIKVSLVHIDESQAKKTSTLVCQQELELLKYKKDDPLRAFVVFEQQKQKEIQNQKISMQLKDELEVDDDQFHEDYTIDADANQGNILNRKKVWGTSDKGLRKYCIFYINSILMNTQYRSKEKFHPAIFETLLQLGLGYLHKASKRINPVFTHKYLIRGFLILNYLGNLEHALSRLRHLRKSEFITSKASFIGYRRFIEYLEVKNLNIVADSSGLLLEFFQNQSGRLFTNEKLSYLEMAVIDSLVAYKTHKKKKITLLLPFCNLQCLPQIKLIQMQQGQIEEYSYTASVCPVEDESVILEVLYWIGQSLQNVSMMIPLASRFAVLLQTILINLDSFSEDLCEYVQKIIQQLSNYDRLSEILYKSQGWKNITRATDPVNLLKARVSLLDHDNQFTTEICKYATIHKVNIINTINSVDAIYDQSLNDWIKLESRNYKYIQKIRPILTIMKPNLIKIEKVRRLIKDLNYSNQIGQLFDKLDSSQYQQNLVTLSGHSQLIEVASALSKFRTLVCNTFYQTFVNNALDFLYISMTIDSLYDRELQYNNLILQFLKAEIIQKEMYKEFIALKEYIDEQTSSFQSWKKTNIRFEVSLDKLLERNRKIMALKWMKKQSGIQDKMQKISKKRSGLKKQEALKIKKDQIKKR